MPRKQYTSGFVYIWRDRKHNRYYIGSHWGSVDDGYICSSNWMRHAYKRRPQDFKRRILEIVTNRSDLLEVEFYWLQMIKSEELGKKYFNLKNSRANNYWIANEESSKTIRERISVGLKQKAKNDTAWVERRKDHAKNLVKNYPPSIETRFKKGQTPWNLGKVNAQVAWNKGNFGESSHCFGTTRTQETKDKMSASLKGKKLGVHWWTNGVTVKQQKECPGENWVKGRKLNNLETI